MTSTRRLGLCLMIAFLVQIALAPEARADAAGPTDYNTVIVSIEPATAAIDVTMIGGDSFMYLEQLEPVEVIISGYQGEPYLRFDPDGTVYENRRSPAVWLNQERYGNEEPPAFANPDARPEWFEIASGGSYAWHDHRSHWMQTVKPPGAEPGDQVLEASVPIDVDGTRVDITVASFLLDPPSPLPSGLGAAIGLAGAAAMWRLTRRASLPLMAATTVAAAIVGFVAFRSVPTETEPSILLALLPALGVVATLGVAALRTRTATTVYLDGLTTAAGGLLLAWGVFRFSALQRALIPSDTPAWLDRVLVAMAIVAGAGIAVRGLYGLLRPHRLERGEPVT